MMSSPTDRIALILRAEASPESIAAILDDAQSELSDINESCADAKARMLDPASDSAAVTKAKKELEDQTLQATRLEAAIGHLAEHLEAAREREAEAARVQRYCSALAERDALAEAILTQYTEAAAKIAEMLRQTAVVDERVAVVNRDLPAGASYLDSVESLTQISGGWPLARSVRLPAIASVGIPEHIRTHPSQQTIWPVGRQ
jgi:chromosome segregation ATPase